MTAVEKIDPYFKWKTLIAEHEKSGLSQVAFCKERNINLSHFGYYRSVIKSKSSKKTNPELFSAVQIKRPELNASAEIKIILPNGFQCMIPSAIDSLQLKRIMEALLSC